jgi:hypothetical protein
LAIVGRALFLVNHYSLGIANIPPLVKRRVPTSAPAETAAEVAPVVPKLTENTEGPPLGEYLWQATPVDPWPLTEPSDDSLNRKGDCLRVRDHNDHWPVYMRSFVGSGGRRCTDQQIIEDDGPKDDNKWCHHGSSWWKHEKLLPCHHQCVVKIYTLSNQPLCNFTSPPGMSYKHLVGDTIIGTPFNPKFIASYPPVTLLPDPCYLSLVVNPHPPSSSL